MHFFPNIKYLDLSRNSIQHIIHLQDCISLKYINLSHNRIRVLSNLERVLGSVTRLNVSHNEIESLDGIDKIYSLERINASHNMLDDFAEVQHVCRLPCLESLVLSDNPISDHVEYRLKVFMEFIQDGGVMMGNRSFPALDGRNLAPAENKKLRRLMFRSTTDAQVETSYADEKYLNREIAGEESESLVEGANPMLPASVTAAAGAKRKQINRRVSADGVPLPSAARSMSTTASGLPGSGPRKRTHSPNKRHSVDNAVTSAPVRRSGLLSEKEDLVVKAPLTSTEFQRASSPRRARMASTSPKRGGMRDSIGSRSMSTGTGTPSTILQELAKIRTFKCKKSSRVKRLAIISYGEKQERFPDLMEIEEFVLQQRLRDEEEQRAKELQHQAMLQQQALELRNQQLLAKRMESFSTVPRGVSVDMHDSMRTHSMSVSGGATAAVGAGANPFISGSGDGSDHQLSSSFRNMSIASAAEQYNRGYSIASAAEQQARGYSIASTSEQQGRGGLNSFDSRSMSITGAGDHYHHGSVSASSTSAHNESARPVASMDDFKGRISDTTKFNFYADSAGSSAIEPSTSLPNTSKMPPPSMITTPTTNLAKHLTNPINSSVRIKVVNPSQMRPSEVEELESNQVGPVAEGENEDDDVENRQFEGDMEEDSESDFFALQEERAAEEEDEYDEYDEEQEEEQYGSYGGNGGANDDGRGGYKYVGDPEYKSLSVMDNLELYFREQVFGPDRPSGEQPFIKDPKAAPFSSSPYANRDDVVFVRAPQYQERFIVLFSEQVIDVTAEAKVNHSHHTDSGATESSGGVGFMRQRSASSAAQPQNEYVAPEIKAILVLTDLNVYLVKQDSFTPDQLFSDAPIPELIRVHPIYSLSNCTIYFGFQRCVLGFFDSTKLEMKNSKNTAITFNDDPTVPHIVQQYMIVTRDKAHTYPIITRLPQIANAIRSNLKPIPLFNVKIENKDAQLLEHVMKYISTMGTDNDIVHYQMVYQVWRTRPGVRIPRTIILTQSLILLCSEELHSVDIGLKVLDSASLKDVFKIYPEDNPLYMTVVFKPSSVFSSRRKWRLCTDSRSTVQRLLEESRRACAEKGNPDV